MTFAVKFGAEWCGPCKMYDPVLSQLADEGYEIYDVDVDELDSETLEDWGVRGIPATFFLNDDGEVIHRTSGARTLENVKEQLDV